MSDLLVQAGDQGVVGVGLLFLTVAENGGGALVKGFLLGLNQPSLDIPEVGTHLE